MGKKMIKSYTTKLYDHNIQENAIAYRDLFKALYDYFDNLASLVYNPKTNLLIKVLQKDLEDGYPIPKLDNILINDPRFVRVIANFESIKNDAVESIMNLQYLATDSNRKGADPEIEPD